MLFLNKGQRPENALISKEIPDQFYSHFIPFAERSYTHLRNGAVFSQTVKAAQSQLWLHHICMNKEDFVFPFTPNPVALLHYMLQGSVRLWLNDVGPVSLHQDTCGLFLIPSEMQQKVHLQPGHYISCHTDFNTDQLQILTEKHTALKVIIQKACHSTPVAGHYLQGTIGFKAKSILEELLSYTGNDYIDLYYLMDSRVNELIRLYVRDISEVNTKLKLSATQVRQLFEVKASILAHLNEPFRIEPLAREQHMADSTLRKLFKSYFNESIKHYFSRQRVEKGLYLLVHSDKSINEISTLLGYENCSSFTRAFTSHLGHPPSYYRKG